MSDSGSSTGETRMLERRVSNNRADLNSDQQMNHFLSWFTQWSDLQKSDFVPVLAKKMTAFNDGTITNGVINEFESMDIAGSNRPPSLFTCQVKLFKEWFSSWSDDQKQYLVMRLQDIDPEFYQNYENRLENPESNAKPKDYFEPGIPEELIKTPTSLSEIVDSSSPEDFVVSNQDQMPPLTSALTTISEDS